MDQDIGTTIVSSTPGLIFMHQLLEICVMHKCAKVYWDISFNNVSVLNLSFRDPFSRQQVQAPETNASRCSTGHCKLYLFTMGGLWAYTFPQKQCSY